MRDPEEQSIKMQLQQMEPYEFEKLVAEVWTSQGYQTTIRQESGDRGIDVEAIKKVPVNQKVLIQAKRYSEGNNVGSNEIRNYATLYQQVDDADAVVIVTSSEFTPQARTLADDLKVKTVSGDELANTIKNDKARYQNFLRPAEDTKPNPSSDRSRDRLKRKLSNFLDESISEDRPLGTGKTQLHIEWHHGTTKSGIVLIYETRGIINRYFCASLETYDELNNVKEYRDKENVKKAKNLKANGNGWQSKGQRFTQIVVEKADKEQVEPELNIIGDILNEYGYGFGDITNIYDSWNDAR